MADLYPTKTRLSLLRAIQAGKVTGYPHYGSDFVEYHERTGPGRTRRVTARVVELMDAQWVEGLVAQSGLSTTITARSDFRPVLTEEGRKVLEAGNA